MTVIKRSLALLAILVITTALLAGCMEGGANTNDSELANLSAGQHIYFGSYPQSSGTPEPIEWRVLEVKDGKALILSEKLLDCHVYDKKMRDTTWETCSLRKWMVGSFINKAFSAAEKERMIEVTNTNPAPPKEGNTGALFAEGGNDTADKVFCLSYDEVIKYIPDEDDRKTCPTQYATDKGVLSVDGNADWWLRTQGYDNKWAMSVKPYGVINTDGHGVDTDYVGVRPAMWVSCGE